MAGVTITATGNGADIGKATTASDGKWEIPLPGAGRYTITLDGLGERLRATEDQVLAGLDDDGERQAFRALLQRLAVHAAIFPDSAALGTCTAERATAIQSC